MTKHYVYIVAPTGSWMRTPRVALGDPCENQKKTLMRFVQALRLEVGYSILGLGPRTWRTKVRWRLGDPAFLHMAMCLTCVYKLHIAIYMPYTYENSFLIYIYIYISYIYKLTRRAVKPKQLITKSSQQAEQTQIFTRNLEISLPSHTSLKMETYNTGEV